MPSEQPSISIGTVTGGQNNIGRTEIAGDQNQTNNYGDMIPAVAEVIDKVVEALPNEIAEPLRHEIVGIASLPPEDQTLKETADKIMAICNKIKPYAGAVGKNLAIFSATALETLAKRNPIINGIVEVCKANAKPQ